MSSSGEVCSVVFTGSEVCDARYGVRQVIECKGFVMIFLSHWL